jgi:hypothetical protein
VADERAHIAAFRDIVAGLLDARRDRTTQRFDDELAAAVRAGLDIATARRLRWWQRESLNALSDHAAEVLPPVIVALDAARDRADERAADPSAPVRRSDVDTDVDTDVESLDELLNEDADPASREPDDDRARESVASAGQLPRPPLVESVPDTAGESVPESVHRRLLVAGLTSLDDNSRGD